MNYVASDSYITQAESAVYLLKKYSKNTEDQAFMEVVFRKDSDALGDAYRIEVDGYTVYVYGNTAVSYNAAVGHLVRNQYKPPENKVVDFHSDYRGVYFANHFYNYYHVAPIEEICEYIESLALWGQSVLTLWFDMHHFQSISSPDAVTMLERMKMMFQKARILGMKTSLIHVINEYYASAPQEPRAENSTEGNRYLMKLCGFFESQLCPSNSEGEKLILSAVDELMAYFAPVGLDYIVLWPYDQGGCTCEKCYPWGSNGFYRLSKKQVPIIKKHFPDLKIIFSCWYFDHFTQGEWEKILPLLQADSNWIDMIMIDMNDCLPDALRTLKKPIVSFPEISMKGATPWGGFGINPFPQDLASRFAGIKDLCSGGFLYSEGIFEDINKVVSLELLRDPDMSPELSIMEYCAYYFGEEYSRELTDIIMRLEKTLDRQTFVDGVINYYPSKKPKTLNRYYIVNQDDIDKIADDFRKIDEKIPNETREQWRYTQLYARIIGDEALLKNDCYPSEETDAIYSKLVSAYHAENAYYFVSPATRKAVMENRGEGI